MDPSAEYLANTVASPAENPQFYERARASLDLAQPSYPSFAPSPTPWTRPRRVLIAHPVTNEPVEYPISIVSTLLAPELRQSYPFLAFATTQPRSTRPSLDLARPSTSTFIAPSLGLIPSTTQGHHILISQSVVDEAIKKIDRIHSTLLALKLRQTRPLPLLIAAAVDQQRSVSPSFVLLPPIVSSVALVPRTAHTPSRRTLVLRSVIDATEQHVACRVSSLLQRLSYDTTVYSLARIPELYERDPYWLAMRLKQPRPLPPVLASVAKQSDVIKASDQQLVENDSLQPSIIPVREFDADDLQRRNSCVGVAALTVEPSHPTDNRLNTIHQATSVIDKAPQHQVLPIDELATNVRRPRVAPIGGFAGALAAACSQPAVRSTPLPQRPCPQAVYHVPRFPDPPSALDQQPAHGSSSRRQRSQKASSSSNGNGSNGNGKKNRGREKSGGNGRWENGVPIGNFNRHTKHAASGMLSEREKTERREALRRAQTQNPR